VSIVQVDIRETGVELAERLLSGEAEDSERTINLYWKGKKLKMETKLHDLGVLSGEKMLGVIGEGGRTISRQTTVLYLTGNGKTLYIYDCKKKNCQTIKLERIDYMPCNDKPSINVGNVLYLIGGKTHTDKTLKSTLQF
jgi:hypothetical protein